MKGVRAATRPIVTLYQQTGQAGNEPLTSSRDHAATVAAVPGPSAIGLLLAGGAVVLSRLKS